MLPLRHGWPLRQTMILLVAWPLAVASLDGHQIVVFAVTSFILVTLFGVVDTIAQGARRQPGQRWQFRQARRLTSSERQKRRQARTANQLAGGSCFS